MLTCAFWQTTAKKHTVAVNEYLPKTIVMVTLSLKIWIRFWHLEIVLFKSWYLPNVSNICAVRNVKYIFRSHCDEQLQSPILAFSTQSRIHSALLLCIKDIYVFCNLTKTIYLNICIFVYLYICVSVYLYICIFVYSYICMFVYFEIDIFFYFYICIFMHLCICVSV